MTACNEIPRLRLCLFLVTGLMTMIHPWYTWYVLALWMHNAFLMEKKVTWKNSSAGLTTHQLYSQLPLNIDRRPPLTPATYLVGG